MKALSDEMERALRVLEEQLRHKDDAAEMERRIVEQCEWLCRKLEHLDFEGGRSLFDAFGMKVDATREDISITLVVDPRVTTIGRTLASPRGRSRRSRWA